MKVITDANVVEIRQADGKIASVVYEDSEGNRTEMAADDFISPCPSRISSTPWTLPASPRRRT